MEIVSRMRKQCILCGAENEKLEHFLLWCPAYSEERQKNVDLQQPYTNEVIGDLLFNNNDIHGSKLNIWNL